MTNPLPIPSLGSPPFDADRGTGDNCLPLVGKAQPKMKKKKAFISMLIIRLQGPFLS